jgi:hypothetical protein
VTVESQLFSDEEVRIPGKGGPGFAEIPFGTRHPTLHRYKLPLLPGEKGTLAGGDWVPRGVQSATNLAGAISESRALGVWERERTQLGLALTPALYERLSFLVRKALHAGLDLDQKLKDQGELGKGLIADLAALHDEARQACKANNAGQEGTNRHDVWEARATTGQLFGTPEINAQVEQVEQLLVRKRLRRVFGLQERVVRNVSLNAAGRFDDILQDIDTGELFMGDLKTKRTPFFSLLEVGIQLVVYASAEFMLVIGEDGKPYYVQGPKFKVSQRYAAVLHMPADGRAEPQLLRINLMEAWVDAQLARQVCDRRSRGKSAETFGTSVWPDAIDPAQWKVPAAS